jgi:hypothetical protein
MPASYVTVPSEVNDPEASAQGSVPGVEKTYLECVCLSPSVVHAPDALTTPSASVVMSTTAQSRAVPRDPPAASRELGGESVQVWDSAVMMIRVALVLNVGLCEVFSLMKSTQFTTKPTLKWTSCLRTYVYIL